MGEGCFSNNYKDCLPHDSSYASCNNVWLPDGPQDSCVALWGDCTGNLSSCCGPAECVNDGKYASCIPPKDVTTAAPTDAPTNMCRVKGESCEKHSDCCKNKCSKNKKKCNKQCSLLFAGGKWF